MRVLPLFERLLLIVVAIMMLILLAFVVAWHVKWNAMQAQIAALVPLPGMGIVDPPAPDGRLWADYQAWGRRTEADDVCWRADVDAWLRGEAVPAPADLDRMRVVIDPYLRDWDALLARGLRPALFSETLPMPDHLRPYFACSTVVKAWALRARLDGDPTAALAGLARMEAALTPASERGLYLLEEIDSLRDHLCLVAELDNRLPAAVRRAWLDQPMRVLAAPAAMEYERLYADPAAYRAYFAMDPLTWWHVTYANGPWSQWQTAVGRWWTIPEQCAAACGHIDQHEADLIAGTNAADPLLYPVMRDDAQHRLGVLADAVIVMRRDTGTLPAAPALDLSGGKYRLPLKYQQLDTDRFAIVIDPAKPLTKEMQSIVGIFMPDLTAPRSSRRVDDGERSVIIIDCAGSGR